jgi:hypothetical protein
MPTRTASTTADALRNAGWAGAALAAGASVLHWITTSSDTHAWSADAALSLVAGAGLMTLAIALAAGPGSARTTRAVALVGAAGTAAVLLAFVLLVLLEPAATTTELGHAGHGAGDQGLSSVEVVRTAVELGLVGVLLWLHRLAGGHRPETSSAAP